MSDDEKNAARNAITELDNQWVAYDDASARITKIGFLAIAKTLWCIAVTLMKIDDKLKK